MLVLSRRLNQKIVLPGSRTTIQVVALTPGVVRLGIEAPPEVAVYREEVWERAGQWGPAGVQPGSSGVGGESPECGSSEQGGVGTALAELAALRRKLRAHRVTGLQANLDRIEQELKSLWRREEEAVGNAS